MAMSHGVEAFCYWHYWFGGRRLLERPFNEVLRSGEPRMPFCLGWANDSWTGIWHGCPGRTLMEQTYPGPEDERRHFFELLKVFADDRYLKVDGRPLMLIYKPYQLPEPLRFTEHWRQLAVEAGLKGIHLVANTNTMQWDWRGNGFDAAIPHNPGFVTHWMINRPPNRLDAASLKLFGLDRRGLMKKYRPRPDVIAYGEYIRRASLPVGPEEVYPCVVPNWDNTPRCGAGGFVLHDATPELFRVHLRQAVEAVAGRPADRRIIFVKSWNEWAEGNYLEPDRRYGLGYLEALRGEILGDQNGHVR
jgi:hypothetical protein